MTAVALTSVRGLPASWDAPVLDKVLSWAVDRLGSSEEVVGPRAVELAPKLREEARRASDVIRAGLAPAEPKVLAGMLVQISVGFSGESINAEEIVRRALAVARLVSPVPIALMTQETQRTMALTFRYWPSVADLGALLHPMAEALRAQADALDTLAQHKIMPPKPVEKPMLDEQRKHMSAGFKDQVDQVAREVRSRSGMTDIQRRVADHVARPITPDQLAELRRLALRPGG